MKIVVLGTAAATSMPLAFCNCTVCRQSRKLGGKNIRKRSSIVINDELLIDLGPDSIHACNMYGIDAGKIKYLLQTHSHSDHFDAGHFVTRWSDYGTKDLSHLDIVCSKGTAEGMNHWINENESIDLFDEEWQTDLNYSLHIVKHGDRIHLGEYEIVAIDSTHDPQVEALFYIIFSKGKSVLYGTDMLEICEEAWKILEKYRFDIVFLDQTYGKGFNAGGHPDAGMVSDYVKTMKRKGIIDEKSFVYATHISHEGNAVHEEMEIEAKANGYYVAYDGMKRELPIV